jgi:hypothetical protein
MISFQEEFEDNKGVIRFCISKKNRQHNSQKKKYKGQTTIYKTYITLSVIRYNDLQNKGNNKITELRTIAMHFHIVKMYKDKEINNVNNFFVNV